MKTVLNKKAKDFKKKDDSINTLKKNTTRWRTLGIDLNENYLIENMNDEAVIEMNLADYLKSINYKIPSNKKFNNEKKKFKQLYRYKWQGIEDVF